MLRRLVPCMIVFCVSRTAAADKVDVCALLKAADFKAAKLTPTTGKAEDSMGLGGCTWDGLHGKAGSWLHVEVIPRDIYDAKKDNANHTTVMKAIGDEALLIETPLSTNVILRKGQRCVMFDGTMKMKREYLEPLARAIAGRL